MPLNSTSSSTLPSNYKGVLHALVTAFPGKGKTSLLKILRALGIPDADGKLVDVKTLPDLLQPLQDAGWVELEQRAEGQYFCVAPLRRNQVLLDLLEAPDSARWLQEIQATLPPLPEWQVAGRPRALQELWLDALSGNPARLPYWLHLTNGGLSTKEPIVHPMQLLQADASGLAVFARLDPEVRRLLLEDCLNYNNTCLGPIGQTYELARREMEHQPDSALGLELLLQAFWRGDWPTLEHLGGKAAGLHLMQQSIQLLLRGEVAGFLQVLRAWITDLRKQTKKRRIDLPPVLNALYCLALLAENDPRQHASLKQALSLGEKQRYGAAYPVLQQLFEQLQGAKPHTSPFLPSTLQGLDGLLLGLGLYWTNAPEARGQKWRATLQGYCDQLHQQGYAWLAAEFDALIAVQFSRPRQHDAVHQSAGLQPLVFLYQRQDAWQHALRALSQLKPAKAQASPGEKTSRLAWMVTVSRYETKVEPREQKLGAKGLWTRGRPVALERLRDDGERMSFLCQQDRQAISTIQLNYGYYTTPRLELPAALALPMLVGHPALYWQDAPDVRLDLHKGEASLHLRVKEGQIQVSIEPDGIRTAQEAYLHKETPTRLVVYPVSGELRHIAEIVGEGLSVPIRRRRNSSRP